MKPVERHRAPPERSVAQPLRILIADDSGLVRRVLKSLLTNDSHHWVVCGEAADGEESLSKANKLKPDVILLDVSIPPLSGVQTAKILQNELPSATVVFMSADDAELIQRFAAAANVPFCISKSSFARELIPLLETIAYSRRPAGGTLAVTG